MNPLDRVRLQEAAADCGFEMTATDRDDGLELRSAHFPAVVHVRPVEGAAFEGDVPQPVGTGGGLNHLTRLAWRSAAAARGPEQQPAPRGL
jgi:hypothetical protein